MGIQALWEGICGCPKVYLSHHAKCTLCFDFYLIISLEVILSTELLVLRISLKGRIAQRTKSQFFHLLIPSLVAPAAEAVLHWSQELRALLSTGALLSGHSSRGLNHTEAMSSEFCLGLSHVCMGPCTFPGALARSWTGSRAGRSHTGVCMECWHGRQWLMLLYHLTSPLNLVLKAVAYTPDVHPGLTACTM